MGEEWRKFRSPCASLQKVSLPVKIMRFPTVVDRGSRYATDAMAKVVTVLLDLLPWLPQTSYLLEQESKILWSLLSQSCALSWVVAKDSLWQAGRAFLPAEFCIPVSKAAIAFPGIASNNISSLSVNTKWEHTCSGIRSTTACHRWPGSFNQHFPKNILQRGVATNKGKPQTMVKCIWEMG